MVIDSEAVVSGFALGALLSLLYFAGLAWGIRLSFRSRQPGLLLLLSSACRITVLLATGVWLTVVQSNSWPLMGYLLAFFLIRIIVVLWGRMTRVPSSLEQEKSSCN